tara:strand:+ start:128 stop:370 length:243 start_codon:yes stop_codon:yes gene_type:complete
MRFTVDTLKSEMEFMKTLFNNERIAQMNGQEERIKFNEYEIENAKIKMDGYASKDDLFDLEKMMETYASNADLYDVREDL